MMFSVPQFIDIEDKIAGPLTWKQLGWMMGMGATMLIVFALFDTALAIIIGIPVVLLFCALAFYKPNGFSLISFMGSSFLFLFRPKIAVWERPQGTAMKAAPPTPVQATEVHVVDKRMTPEKLAALARMIDQR